MVHINRLTARSVAAIDQQGIYADGAGLYLKVRGETQKAWVFIWQRDGRRREMGLGSSSYVTLRTAREKAQEVRDKLARGIDPLAEKKAARATPSFGDLADEFIRDRAHTVKSEKSIARWRRAIGEGGDAKALRPLEVDKITTEQVLPVLRAVWSKKPGSAAAVRGYIEDILNIAKIRGFRSGDNPAAWKGHLEHLLAKPKRLSRGHHKALAYGDVPAFVTRLRGYDSHSALALEMTILCATRTSETLNARWREFDLAERYGPSRKSE